MIETDVLIVGTGPAGGSAALFLSHYNVKTVVITKYKWLADTPRAHITNQRTMEILRDAGVAERAVSDSVPNHLIGNSILCESLAGREIGRIKSWGASAERLSEYRLNSPFEICDIPQTYLEPILLAEAAKNGVQFRFSSEFLSLTQDENSVTAVVKDRTTDTTYKIRAKYVIGADGGRSRVAEAINLPMIGEMGLAGSINILFKADLTKYVAHRPSALFWMLHPEARIGGLSVGLLRMVRPWNEWLCVWSYDISAPEPKLTESEAIEVIHKILGDSKTAIDISSISTWTVNKAYASSYSAGRVYCVGDAVHRHPPNNGLGSNTSIQDSYNLAWKLAYVIKGTANPKLLDTFSSERSPIGKEIVTRAIESIRETKEILSIFEDDEDVSGLNLQKIYSESEEGIEVRERLAKAIQRKNYEFNCLGVESNIIYESSAVVQSMDNQLSPVDQLHSAFHSKIVVGARFPHAWVTKGEKEISTLDLVGKGKFSLLVGVMGRSWIDSARQKIAGLAIPFSFYIIGPGGDVEDIYFDMRSRLDFQEDMFVLIRPDGHVAWFGITGKCPSQQIVDVMKSLLGIEGAAE